MVHPRILPNTIWPVSRKLSRWAFFFLLEIDSKYHKLAGAGFLGPPDLISLLPGESRSAPPLPITFVKLSADFVSRFLHSTTLPLSANL